MRDVQLFDTSNSQIILRVGTSVFENASVQKIMRTCISDDATCHENLNSSEEDVGNFSLNSENGGDDLKKSKTSFDPNNFDPDNLDSSAVCYLRVNVSLPLHWPDYSNDRLPPAAQSDVKNSQLFWLLQSSGPIMYGKIGSVTDNFWRIRTFAACQSNIAQGKLSLIPKVAEGIKSSLDNLSRYLQNFENMLPGQLALSTILWQIHDFGESEEYWAGVSEEQRFGNILKFLKDNFKNGRVQDFFLPEMNLLSLVPDMTIMYILGKINERLGSENATDIRSDRIRSNSKLSVSKISDNSSKLSENESEPSSSKENIDLPKIRDNRDSRLSSSDVAGSTISAPTVSSMMQPTGGLSRAQRKTSSLSGMLGTKSHDRRNRVSDLEEDIKLPKRENSLKQYFEETPETKDNKHVDKFPPIPKHRSRNNIAKASRDSGLSDESCVFDKSELKLAPQKEKFDSPKFDFTKFESTKSDLPKSDLPKFEPPIVEIVSGSHGIMVGLKKVDIDTRSEISSSSSSKSENKPSKLQSVTKVLPVAPVRHESRTQLMATSVQNNTPISSSSFHNADRFKIPKSLNSPSPSSPNSKLPNLPMPVFGSPQSGSFPLPIATSTLNRDYRRVSQAQSQFNTLASTRNHNFKRSIVLNESIKPKTNPAVEWEMNI